MKNKNPTVSQCIARIEETDYKLVKRGKLRFRGVIHGRIGVGHGGRGQVCFGGPALYIFRSEKRPECFRELRFTLNELRHAYHNGF